MNLQEAMDIKNRLKKDAQEQASKNPLVKIMPQVSEEMEKAYVDGYLEMMLSKAIMLGNLTYDQLKAL